MKQVLRNGTGRRDAATSAAAERDKTTLTAAHRSPRRSPRYGASAATAAADGGGRGAALEAQNRAGPSGPRQLWAASRRRRPRDGRFFAPGACPGPRRSPRQRRFAR